MAHCSMFKSSEEFGMIRCVIDRRFKSEFESLGFTNNGQSIIDNKEEIDPLTLHNKNEVEEAIRKCKELGISRYKNMKHETRIKKIKELEGDN